MISGGSDWRELGAAIRDARVEAGLSLRQFATMLGTTERALGDVERGVEPGSGMVGKMPAEDRPEHGGRPMTLGEIAAAEGGPSDGFEVDVLVSITETIERGREALATAEHTVQDVERGGYPAALAAIANAAGVLALAEGLGAAVARAMRLDEGEPGEAEPARVVATIADGYGTVVFLTDGAVWRMRSHAPGTSVGFEWIGTVPGSLARREEDAGGPT